MARPRTIAFQAVSVKISLSPSGVIIALVADRPYMRIDVDALFGYVSHSAPLDHYAHRARAACSSDVGLANFGGTNIHLKDNPRLYQTFSI